MPPKIAKTPNMVLNLLGDVVNSNLDEFEFLSERSLGWEKWFQIEVASRLKKIGAQEVNIEHRFSFDAKKINNKHRIEQAYKTGSIDITFVPKSYRSQIGYVGIELKLADGLKGLKGVLADIVKLHASKRTEWAFRSLYFVLLYKENEDKTRQTKYDKLLVDLKKIQPTSCYAIQFERAVGFKAVVVYWDPNKGGKSCDIKLYNEWFEKIKKLYAKYGLFENHVSSAKKAKSAASSPSSLI